MPDLGPYRVRYLAWACQHLLACGALLVALDRTLFDLGAEDGLFIQISRFWSVGSGLSGPLLAAFDDPLAIVHCLRFLVLLPFLAAPFLPGSKVLEVLYLLAFILPVVLVQKDGRNHAAQPFLAYFACFFSFRGTLCMAAMAYLFAALFLGRHRVLLAVSLLLANLSSGVLLPWLVIVGYHHRRAILRQAWAVALLAVASVSLAFSIMQKESFFTGQGAASDIHVPNLGDGLLFNAVARNTILVSLHNGMVVRAAAYTAMLLLGLLLAAYLLLNHRVYAQYVVFQLCFLLSMLVEGIGPISFCMALGLFLLMVFRKTTLSAERQAS